MFFCLKKPRPWLHQNLRLSIKGRGKSWSSKLWYLSVTFMPNKSIKSEIEHVLGAKTDREKIMSEKGNSWTLGPSEFF